MHILYYDWEGLLCRVRHETARVTAEALDGHGPAYAVPVLDVLREGVLLPAREVVARLRPGAVR